MARTTFTQNLLGFPSAENGTLSLSVDVDENAAPVSRGPTNAEDGNIIYVNVIPEIPEAKALLAQSQKEVELASSFWSLKATEAVDDKKNNYKLQAMDYAIQHSGWMCLQSTQNVHKKWALETKDLHEQILKTILAGLGIPEESLTQFENIFQSIADGIRDSKQHSTDQIKWVLLTLYRYDPVQKSVVTTIRTIHFSFNQKQAGWLTKTRPKGINNEFELIYKQEDYALNLCLWDRVKDGLQDWVDLKNSNLVRNAINIPVRNFGQNEIGM